MAASKIGDPLHLTINKNTPLVVHISRGQKTNQDAGKKPPKDDSGGKENFSGGYVRDENFANALAVYRDKKQNAERTHIGKTTFYPPPVLSCKPNKFLRPGVPKHIMQHADDENTTNIGYLEDIEGEAAKDLPAKLNHYQLQVECLTRTIEEMKEDQKASRNLHVIDEQEQLLGQYREKIKETSKLRNAANGRFGSCDCEHDCKCKCSGCVLYPLLFFISYDSLCYVFYYNTDILNSGVTGKRRRKFWSNYKTLKQPTKL